MNNAYISSRRKPHPSPRINVGSTIPCRFGALLLLGLVVFSLAGCDEAKKILDTLNITPPGEEKIWCVRHRYPYNRVDTRYRDYRF